MITTTAVIKTILNITDSTYDTRIATLLPMVELDIIEYCNNRFLNKDIYFSGDITIKVSSGPVYTLECADGGITASGITTGDNIYLTGSKRNDGYLTVSNQSDTILTITEQLYAEAEQSLTVYLTQFPQALVPYVAQMVWYKMDKVRDAGLTGETIKSYSYTRSDGGAADAGYPQEILRGLDKWRNIRVVKTDRRERYNDKRGTYIADYIDGPLVAR